jgi:hypothetical protein
MSPLSFSFTLLVPLARNEVLDSSRVHALAQAARSRQGKMEKSFLSFAATYPTWEPDSAAKQMLIALGQAPPLRTAGGAQHGPEADYLQSAIAASLFPGAPRLAF